MHDDHDHDYDVREEHHGEEAFNVLSTGIGRRDLLKASAAISAGAIAPA